jgi:hypothetical protein
MYTLAMEPKEGNLADAYKAIEDAFGTGEFTDGQAVSAICLNLEVDDARGYSLFKNLIERGCVAEV